ncbi:MAG: hypothetical protein P1V34_12800 [Alphaproteobacteria bacterium]|nr:hypothetical protein [Alphaproteobacteria bacterium]
MRLSAIAICMLIALILVFALLLRPTVPPLGPGSRFMVHQPEGVTPGHPFAFRMPERYALIVYVNGSTSESKPDLCNTSRPGINIPKTATDLVGRRIGGYEILLYAFCTPTKVGGFNQPDGDGVPKVIRRADELQALLAYIAETGFPPERTFVMGQSAGGWAGLLVARRGKTPFAGLVAFAPAFAGYTGYRKDVWQVERDRQAAFIAQAPRINALVFGFEQDRYEPPRVMQWLRNIPGVTYVALSGRSVFGMDCDNKVPHATVFKDCFRYFQHRRILDYLEAQLPAGTS